MTNNPLPTPPVETLSEEALAEIEARANAATPGPLEARLGSGNNVCTALASIATATFDEFVCDVLPDYACNLGITPRWEANRNFIEHVFTDIPALCRTLRAQQAALRDMGQRALKWLERYPDLDAISLVTENTALREQLVQHEEVNRQLMKDLDRATGECRELQDERDRLRERLAYLWNR